MTTATATRVSREILEDRYDGLIYVGDSLVGGTVKDRDWSKRQLALSDVAGDIACRTARCHRDDVGPIMDELYPMIREHIIRRIAELGIAR